MTAAKLKIETWPIERVLAYAQNARLHSAEQVSTIARSITEFGFVNPCLVDADGVLIAGHGRVMAGKQLGLATVPVIRLGHLTEQQARAYRLADNAIGLQSRWSPEMLKIELTELKISGYNLDLTGFPEIELVQFLAGIDDDNDPEATPEPLTAAASQEGDLWILGNHRLMCGDCTKTEDVAALFSGEHNAKLMATDPPYGVAYDNAERPNPGVAKPRVAKPRVANDELIDGPAMQAFLESMLKAALPHMDAHAAFYFWHPMLTQGTYVAAAAAAAGILIHRQIIWVKPVLLLGRGDYHWRHELCFYGWQKGNRPPFYGPRDQDTIWEVASVGIKERKEMNHATPKPVALWDKPIANHTKRGEILYEPFAGSGTQIIAAEIGDRKCYALEIDPHNVDVSVRRWQDFTKKQAVLANDGRTWAELAAEAAQDAPDAPETTTAQLQGKA